MMDSAGRSGVDGFDGAVGAGGEGPVVAGIEDAPGRRGECDCDSAFKNDGSAGEWSRNIAGACGATEVGDHSDAVTREDLARLVPAANAGATRGIGLKVCSADRKAGDGCRRIEGYGFAGEVDGIDAMQFAGQSSKFEIVVEKLNPIAGRKAKDLIASQCSTR